MSALSNCVIAVSGTFEGYTQAAIKKLITDNGGEFSPSVKASTTHLVTNSDDYNKNGAKVSSATAKGLPIVTLAWVEASIKKKSAVKTDPYLLSAKSTSNGGAAAATAATADKKKTISGKKRHVDADGDDDNDAAADVKDTKRGRATKQKKTDAVAPAAAPKKGRGKKKAATPEEESEPEEEEEEEEDEAPPSPDGEEIKEKERQKKYKAPVDDACPLRHTHEVYEDSDHVKYDANLNQTNIGGNNNKFYIAQLLKSKTGNNFATWTHWGRVGESGQSAQGPQGTFDQALKLFEKKFKDKTGCTWADRDKAQKSGKYWYLEKDYAPPEDEEDDKDGIKKEDEPIESKLPGQVQELMQLIFNKDFMQQSMANMNYDSKKLPLGRLGKKTIKDGYSALKAIAELLNDDTVRADDERFLDLTNRYYTIIPHSFGRDRPTIISNNEILKREIELVESLGEMEIADKIMKMRDDVDEDGNRVNPLDHRFKSLKLDETTPLEHDSQEFQILHDYFHKTAGFTHSHLKGEIIDIFRIERNGEFDRFAKAGWEDFSKDNRRLLWHGSRATNFAGILSQGLRIAPPEAPVTGYMFGKGVYLADISTKSANYCSPSISNGVALMLLGVAQLGSMYEILHSDYHAGENSKKAGHESTMGKGRTAPKGWMDAGVVHPSMKGVQMPDPSQMTGDSNVNGAYLQYNEYIVYDVNQIKLRYLFKIDFGNARGWY